MEKHEGRGEEGDGKESWGPWKFFALVFGKIWPAAPSLVLLLLTLCLAGYGLYSLPTLLVNAQEASRKDYEEKLKVANERMVDTYDKLASMSKSMIENVSLLLTLQETVRTNMEARQHEISVLQDELGAKVKHVDEMNGQVTNLQARLLYIKQQSIETELNTAKRLAETHAVRSNLVYLASLVIKSRETSNTTLASTARTLSRLYAVDSREVLTTFARLPTKENREALFSLAGVPEEMIKEYAAATNGFKYWTSDQESWGGGTVLVGVLDQAGDVVSNRVEIVCKDKKVHEVHVASPCIYVWEPSNFDWLRPNLTYFQLPEGDSPPSQHGVYLDSIVIMNGRLMKPDSTQIISGDFVSTPVLPLDVFAQRYSGIFDACAKRSMSLQRDLALLKKARTWNSQKLEFPKEAPDALKNYFRDLFAKALVWDSTLNNLGDSANLGIGKLVALELGTEFRFRAFTKNNAGASLTAEYLDTDGEEKKLEIDFDADAKGVFVLSKVQAQSD